MSSDGKDTMFSFGSMIDISCGDDLYCCLFLVCFTLVAIFAAAKSFVVVI